MRSMMRGCSASTMHEDAGRDALADGVVDDALLDEDAAVLPRDQHLDHLVAVGLGAVHARHVGHQAGGVGDRAISTMVLEPSTNSTSMRGFMFRRVASSR